MSFLKNIFSKKLASLGWLLIFFTSACNSNIKVRSLKKSQALSADFKIVDVNVETLESGASSTTISWTTPSSKTTLIEIVLASDESCKDNIVGSFTVKSNVQEISNIEAHQFQYVCLYGLNADKQRISSASNNPYYFSKVQPSASSTPEASPLASSSPSASASTSPTATPTPGNVAPTLTFVEPKNNNDSIAKDATFSITWTDSDPDNDAQISLYYKAAATGACSTGTSITSGISEDANGTNGSYSWDTTGITPGTYYICARIDDGVNTAVDVWSDSLVINTPPTFTWVMPASGGSSGTSATLSWTDADPEDDASISFYYKTTNTGACSTGTLITSGISEDSATNTYSWDVSAIASNNSYYICARINDNINDAVEVWSGTFHLYRECVWTGTASQAWATVGNWNNCRGVAPTQHDKVVIPVTANTPIISASTTIYKFEGPATGGGTLTINAGRTLTLNGREINSDLTLQGDTATCTTCNVSSWTLTIGNSAHLTLGTGISIAASVIVGTSTSAGHLYANQAANPSSQWPTINDPSFQIGANARAIKTQGTNTENSTLYLNGIKLRVPSFDDDVGFRFMEIGTYSTINNFDNIDFNYNSTEYSRDIITFDNSCNLITINDTTWSNLNFGSNVVVQAGDYTLRYPANCATPITVSNPTGLGAHYSYVSDPGTLVTWPATSPQNCTWNGSSSIDWTDVANWSNCSARSGVPDAIDFVEIVSGMPHDPAITSNTAIRGFAGGSGGGHITVSNNTSLFFTTTSAAIQNDVSFGGNSTTCTTCQVVVQDYHGSINVNNGATLTLKSGITIPATTNIVMNIGNSTTAGHLRLEGGATSAEYPVIQANARIDVAGASGNISSLYIDGVSTPGNSGRFALNNYYEIKKIDRVSTAYNYNSASVAYFTFRNCANATFTANTWTGLDFYGTPDANTKNIDINAASCPAISLSGTGAGYGATYAIDPFAYLTWN